MDLGLNLGIMTQITELTGLTFEQFVLLCADVFFTGIFLILLFRRVKSMKALGLIKWLLVITFVWGITRFIGLDGLSTITGTILQFALLGAIIIFPQEFRTMLANFGRRKLLRFGFDYLISKDNRKEVVEAVSALSKLKRGSLIVIARENGLDDVIATGKDLGSLEVSAEVIEMLSTDNRMNNGALVIKDNKIVSVNCQLPIVTNEQLTRAGASTREFAGLGAVEKYGAVAICVDDGTGKISLMGMLGKNLSVDLGFELKERNIQAGVSETAILERLNRLVENKQSKESLQDLDKPKEKKKAMSKEERMALREQQRKEKLAQREQRITERDKQKREAEGNDDGSSSGFFG